MSKERHVHPAQMSMLTPADAEMLHMLKLFVAEASRIYQVRTGQSLEDALQINSPGDAYEYLRFEMEALEQEQLRTINLNTKHRIISSSVIAQGGLNTTYVRIADVFRPAILDNAAAILVAHNHPSGECDVSPEDVRITKQLVEAGNLLDLPVLDHIVIGRGHFVSMKERGVGFGELSFLGHTLASRG